RMLGLASVPARPHHHEQVTIRRRSGAVPTSISAGTIASHRAIGGPMPPRAWGWWTEQKLDILSDYLAAFNKASAKAGTTVYLDLFAGRAQNVSRSRTEHLIRGSARRALETTPPFTVLRIFELAGRAAYIQDTPDTAY